MARPNLSYLKNLIFFLFGLPFGVLTGLTGIANSVAVVPAVRYLQGLRPSRANGTALAVTFFAALAALLSYAQSGDVRWGLALVLAAGQIIGAAWGQRLVAGVPALARLHLLWAILIVAAGLGMMAHGMNIAGGQPAPPVSYAPPGIPAAGPLFFLWSALVALLVGLVSRVVALGGVLLVPAGIYLLGLPPHLAQGTAIVVLLIASLPGMLIHARRGDVEPQSATWLSAGAVFGGLVGAFDATQVLVSERTLLTLFGFVLALLGLLMLWRREGTAAAG